MRTGKVKGF